MSRLHTNGGETVARVNRVIDHVVRHLDQDLSLEALAAVACLSPFHFHRVFKAVQGETLAAFVKRLRLERALVMMQRQPGASLTEVALACGFGSSSDFSRSFRQRFGTAPSGYDLATHRRNARRRLQTAFEDPSAGELLAPLPEGANPDGFEPVLRDLPARTVVYRRVLAPYRQGVVEAAAERLVDWASARELDGGQWLGYMWDDPDVVALEDCRYDVGLVVPPDTDVTADFGRLEFPAMRVAELSLDGPIDLEQRALDWLFDTWLPRSDYLPADQPCFEAWLGLPFAHGMERFTLSVQLPVVSV